MIARWIAGRVVMEIVRDRRTLALIFVVPLVVMTLVYYVFKQDENAKIAVVTRGVARVFEADLLDALRRESDLTIVRLDLDDEESDPAVIEATIQRSLKDTTTDGVLYMTSKLLEDRFAGERGTLNLYLEGSRPTISASVLSGIREAMDDLANALPTVIDDTCSGPCADSVNTKPMVVDTHFTYGSEDLGWLDYLLPVLPPFFVFFFTFMVATISFQRERARGTLERLVIAPISFGQVVNGYIGGFVAFAVIQAGIILTYFLVLMNIPLSGAQIASLIALMFILLLISLTLGLLTSYLANNEFQAVQMVPMVILPQVFLSDIIWSIDSFHPILKYVSYAMPLTHANIAVRNVLIKDETLWANWPHVATLLAFFVVLTVMLRRPRAG
jgi:ABC-2 type transport system permease protein